MEPNFNLKNKNILVTGGAGFIGSNLCEYLLNCYANVTCLDNFVTGSNHNIESFQENSNFRLIEGDIRDLKTCQLACEGQDYVLHQAALGSVPRSIIDPILSNEVNVSGFLNMLIAARDQKIKRFIFASSSSTYGDSEKLPKVEDKIGNLLSPYAITKYVNELYAYIFYKTYGLEYIGLRYFNVFGRRQDPKGAYAAVIPIFINKLINLESPVINGDGSYSRDFTHIDNIILINILALTTENSHSINQIYNAGAGDQTTLIDLVKYLKKYLSLLNPKINNVHVIFGPNRQGDIPHSLASIEKAVFNLKYSPINDFEKGIKKSINWYWKNLK